MSCSTRRSCHVMFYQEVMSCHVLPGGLGIVLLTNLILCYFTGPRGRFHLLF